MLIVRRTEQESLLRSTLLAKVLEPRAHRLVEAGDARALACDCAGRVTSSPRSRRWRASRQGWYDRAGPQALARAARRLVNHRLPGAAAIRPRVASTMSAGSAVKV